MKWQKIREWFKLRPERQTLFALGLLFANGMANYMLKVLVTFLTDIWKIDLRHAVKIINILGGASAILGIFVVSLADYLGHYWMVIMTSILYCLGLGLLSKSVPRFFLDGSTQTCPSGAKICAKNLKSSAFYWALPFIAIAKAGLFVSLAALTFDKLKSIKLDAVQGPRRWRRFGPWRFKENLISARQKHKNWLRILCGTFLTAGGFTASVGFSTFHKDWHSRFEVSACVIAGGVLVFLSGYSFHPPAWVRQSPLVTVFKGFYATIVEPVFTNRRHCRSYLGAGHIEVVSINRHLLQEDSAISDQGQNQRFCYVFHGWIRCTEEQKNELKRLRCLIPISLTFIMYGLIKSNSDTFFIEQGKTVKRHIRINAHNIHISGKIPIQLLSFIADVTKYAIKPVYRIIFEKRITRNKGRYSHAMKIGLGLLAGLFSCFAASVAEAKRRNSLEDHGLLNNPDGIAPISMFWLTPQFVLIGMMEGLAYDGMRDFFEHSVHSSMTRYGVVLREVATGLGKMLNSVFVFALDTVVIKVDGKEASWFADTVNGGHLDYYFRAVVVASLLNLLAFAYAATAYQYPQVKATDEEEDTLEKIANTVEIV